LNGVVDFQSGGVGGDVVDAKNGGAAPYGHKADGDGAEHAAFGVALASQRADETFAGDSDDEGAAQSFEIAQAVQQRQIVFDCFSETDSRIDVEATGVNADVGAEPQAFFKKTEDVGHYVFVDGGFLHCFGRALHVHQHDAAGRPREKFRQCVVVTQGGYIVDQRCAFIEAGGCDFGGARIDTDRQRIFGAKQFQYRQYAAELFGRGNLGAARSGRFSAYVKKGGAFSDIFQGAIESGVRIEEFSAVGETVGGDVEDGQQLRRF